MVSIVVGDQERLAQDCLTITVRDQRKEISGWIGHELLQLFQVLAESLYRLFPERDVASGIRVRPIAFRKIRRDMFWVAAEFQNVRLGDPHVLQHLPWCVGNAINSLIT